MTVIFKPIVMIVFSFFMCGKTFATEIFYFYDSDLHSTQTIFSVTKFDVNKSNKIKTQINKQLVFNSQRSWTKEELELEARKRISNDPKLKNLMNEISDSYKYLQKALEFRVTKVPAIVLVENGHNWIVYGETNIQKALVLIRNSNEFKRTVQAGSSR